MTENKHLIPVEKTAAAILFSEKLDYVLAEIEKQAIDEVPDTTTAKGRDAIVALAFKVTRSKTFIDKLGLDANAERKKETDRINSYRKKAREFLDDLRDRIRKPFEDWEAEQAKIAAEKAAAEKKKIDGRIKDLAEINISMDHFDVASMTDEAYKTFYAGAKDNYEADQERLRKEAAEKAEREAAEKAEREKKEAELKAEAERLEKVRKEQEAKEAELKAAQDKIDAAKKAEQEAKDKAELEARLKAEAKAQAEKEAKEAAEKAAQEKIDAEIEAQRKLAMLPDKEKLREWLSFFDLATNNPVPIPESSAAKQVLHIITGDLEIFLQDAFEKVEKL